MEKNSKTKPYRQQIQQAESKLVAAMKINDVPSLDELLHDDLLFIAPDGQTVTKAMDLEAHRSGTMIVEEAIATIEVINIIGDIAVTTTLLKAKGKMLGQALAGEFRYIRVWKLFGKSWRVVGGSCTPLN
jgi:ketosteroid isomerase-like protein